MKNEVKYKLIKHIDFLESEIKDYEIFSTLSWIEYNDDRNKRRNVERWIENVINSTIDISKIILSYKGIKVPDTYKEIVDSLCFFAEFDKENIKNISKWVKLRNIITHSYLDIKWSHIKKFIAETKLYYFVFLEQLKKLIAETPELPG